MSNDKFDIDDMALEDEKKDEKLNMSLESPDVMGIANRIQKLFPEKDLVNLIDDLKVVKMADGSYTILGEPLKEVSLWDVEKLDNFLKGKGV